MAKGSRRRQKSRRRYHKTATRRGLETPEVPVAPVITYSADQLPADSALRRRPPTTETEAGDRTPPR